MKEADAKAAVHAAIGELLDDGEIPISWVVVVDVAGPGRIRYLAHRAGGGHDGSDMPMAWTALGMMEAASQMARDQLRDMTVDVESEDDDDQTEDDAEP